MKHRRIVERADGHIDGRSRAGSHSHITVIDSELNIAGSRSRVFRLGVGIRDVLNQGCNSLRRSRIGIKDDFQRAFGVIDHC